MTVQDRLRLDIIIVQPESVVADLETAIDRLDALEAELATLRETERMADEAMAYEPTPEELAANEESSKRVVRKLVEHFCPELLQAEAALAEVQNENARLREALEQQSSTRFHGWPSGSRNINSKRPGSKTSALRLGSRLPSPEARGEP